MFCLQEDGPITGGLISGGRGIKATVYVICFPSSHCSSH